MVLFSTRESIHGDQISLLALAETLIAIGISLFLYFHFRFVNHILISAAIAPFLLLRTPRISDQSINIGEDVLNKIVVYFNKFENSLAIPFIIFLYVIAVVALSFAIKATVILYNTV